MSSSQSKGKQSPTIKKTGSKRQVYLGKATSTVGGLTKSDIRKKQNNDGTVSYVSKRKSQGTKDNWALRAWTIAAREEGYMLKGDGFKPLPKKGTKEYQAIRQNYEELKQHCDL